MRGLIPILQLLLATATAYGLVLLALPVFGWMLANLGGAAIVAGPILGAWVFQLPGVLLAVLWLRSLGGAPRREGAGPALQAAWRSSLWVLALVVANALALFFMTFLWGLVMHSALRATADGPVDPGRLGTVALIHAGIIGLTSIAILMAFLPTLLSRLGSVPPAAVAYRGGWKRSQVFGLSIAALLLDYALRQAIAWLARDPSADSERSRLFVDIATALLGVLLPVLFALLFWRLLWRPLPKPAAAPAAA